MRKFLFLTFGLALLAISLMPSMNSMDLGQEPPVAPIYCEQALVPFYRFSISPLLETPTDYELRVKVGEDVGVPQPAMAFTFRRPWYSRFFEWRFRRYRSLFAMAM